MLKKANNVDGNINSKNKVNDVDEDGFTTVGRKSKPVFNQSKFGAGVRNRNGQNVNYGGRQGFHQRNPSTFQNSYYPGNGKGGFQKSGNLAGNARYQVKGKGKVDMQKTYSQEGNSQVLKPGSKSKVGSKPASRNV